MKVKIKFKKIFKVLGLSFLGIFVAANLFLIFSGKFYLYKAVYNTYFHGQSGPGIYDAHFFYNRIVENNEGSPWAVHPRANSIPISDKNMSVFEELETTSFLVIKNNFIIHEQYWGEHTDTTISNSFSVAKSIVSLLIGVAVDEGKIESIDDPVGKYLDYFDQGQMKEITIRHLLTMSAGLNWDESGANPFSHNAEAYYGWDLEALVKTLEIIEEPGVVFDYKSGYTQILAFVLQAATGEELAEYASEKIWKQVSAENNAKWSLDDEFGQEKAFCCFYATTRDFARIGRIIHEKGSFRENKIVSSNYINQMLTPDDTLKRRNGLQNDIYGFQWWIYHHPDGPVYYARGILGQYIICLPEEDIIIVRTGHQRGEVIRSMEVAESNGIPVYQIDHPSDLFMYVDLAKEMGKKF